MEKNETNIIIDPVKRLIRHSKSVIDRNDLPTHKVTFKSIV
jgi:hypothetical protein